MRVARIVIATTALAAGASLIIATPAGAHTTKPLPTPTPTVLTTAVGAPFNLEVRHGRVLVADGAGQIGKVQSDGTVKTVVGGVEGASGVALSRNGKYLAYTHTVGGPPAGITDGGVTIEGPRAFKATADTLAYEKANNPDKANHYGLADPSQCTVDPNAPDGVPPLSYTGAIDSHAYSLTAFGKGFVLADAGANALLRISRTGAISTLAVLPPQPATVTKEAAAGVGLICSGDVTYNFEPVPTDVEVGEDGFLYVTTLPGGPEDPSLGARGKVYRVNPWNGKVKEVATGLLGATNLALSGGKIYVAELFAGRISVIKHGLVAEYLPLPGALAVESGRGGTLYAATGITGPPSIVRIDTHKGWRH